MVETTPDTNEDGEVAPPENAIVLAPHKADAQVQQISQLRTQNLELVSPRAFKVTLFWDRIYSDDFTLSDDYTFNYREISAYRNVHVLEAYTQYRKRRVDAYLDEHEQRSIMSELCVLLDSAQLLEADKLPGFTFNRPKILLRCANLEVLMKSYELLAHKDRIGRYSMSFVAKGFPFKPTFWRFDGLLADPDEKRLIKDARMYLSKHVSRLGKTRAAWARFYSISGLDGKRAFSGSLLVLTDAATIVKDGDTPLFRGVKPEQLNHGYLD